MQIEEKKRRELLFKQREFEEDLIREMENEKYIERKEQQDMLYYSRRHIFEENTNEYNPLGILQNRNRNEDSPIRIIPNIYGNEDSQFSLSNRNIEEENSENEDEGLIEYNHNEGESDEDENDENEDEEEKKNDEDENLIIKELKVNKLKNVKKLSEDKKECVICYETFKNGDSIISLPCIHIFHDDCIKSWLKKSKTCPICKYNIQ